MGINIRTKGQSAEREIATMLNEIVCDVRKQLSMLELEPRDFPFQRNQNQSAVGGDDLTNPFGLSIEVKRQEQLSINSWWKQTVASAARTDGRPILMYRQNRKQWKVILDVCCFVNTDEFSLVDMRAEVSIDDFKKWFREYYKDNMTG